jgi:hypothetical protein
LVKSGSGVHSSLMGDFESVKIGAMEAILKGTEKFLSILTACCQTGMKFSLRDLHLM